MKKRNLMKVAFFLTAVFLLGGCSDVNSQSSKDVSKYPDKPVELVVPASAGGGTDMAARLVARYLEPELGVSIPITNTSGASGAIALNDVKNADPNGYKLIFHHENLIQNKVNGVTDFMDEAYEMAGIPLVSNTMTLYTNGEKFKNFDELKSYAKENPGQIIAASKPGSSYYQALMALQEALGDELKMVDVGDVSEMVASMAGKHIDISVAPMGTINEYVKSGDFYVICQFRDTPGEYDTSVDCDIDYMFNKFYWLGFPDNTPQEYVQVWSNALEKICQDPEFIKEAKALELEVKFYNSEQTREYIKVAYEQIKGYIDKYGSGN
ncbi:MAG: tripartite tricarboxylate transporter substrate binding protein [Clostridiaceae bacterium]|nr:tripartite tricarboxylate transporter substrate binding protein [Clostridiaceae bacterium]